jgi:hypothetical protein
MMNRNHDLEKSRTSDSLPLDVTTISHLLEVGDGADSTHGMIRQKNIHDKGLVALNWNEYQRKGFAERVKGQELGINQSNHIFRVTGVQGRGLTAVCDENYQRTVQKRRFQQKVLYLNGS